MTALAADYVPIGSEPRYGSRRPSRTKARPQLINARALDAMHFDPIKYVVPGYIAEGCTILAGRPKLGKSWFVLEAALAIASGGACLGGIECEQGDVLYLALEDNRRRLQSRIRRLWETEEAGRIPLPDRLHLATEWPRATEGGIDEIRAWVREHPDARLVVVDVLAMFKSPNKGKDQTLYEADYAAVKGLQGLASETGVAIVIVHHTRKSGVESDPFEKVSGTLGLSGAADTVLILDRDQNGATLYGRGRDIEEIETAVSFDRMSCTWKALGNVADVRRTDERTVILDALRDNREAMSPAEVADALGLQRNNVKQLLFKMAKAGEVQKAKKGRYAHPDFCGYEHKDAYPDNFDNQDNHDTEEGDENQTVIAVTGVIGSSENTERTPEQKQDAPRELPADEYDRCLDELIAKADSEQDANVLQHHKSKGNVVFYGLQGIYTRGRF